MFKKLSEFSSPNKKEATPYTEIASLNPRFINDEPVIFLLLNPP